MPSGELKTHVAQPSAAVRARATGQPLTIADLFNNLLLTSERADDGERSEPQAQAKTLFAIFTLQGLAKLKTIDELNRALERFSLDQQQVLLDVWRGKRQASLETIAIVAGFRDKKTADRAIQVLGRAVGRTLADAGRDAVLLKERGKGGRASRYIFVWDEMRALCADDRLQLVAAAAASGELDPLGGQLDPLDPPLDPVEGAGGRGGPFLAAQQQEQEPLPPPPPFAARYGVERNAQGVKVETQGVKVEADGDELDWAHFGQRFQAVGVNSPKHRREWFDAACERRWRPGDLDGLLDFYAEHKGAWKSPGVLNQAIRNGPSSDDFWPLFPPPVAGYVADPAEQARRKEPHAETNRESERATLTMYMRRAGWSVANINARLAAEGYEPLATVEIGWRELRRCEARPREPGEPP